MKEYGAAKRNDRLPRIRGENWCFYVVRDGRFISSAAWGSYFGTRSEALAAARDYATATAEKRCYCGQTYFDDDGNERFFNSCPKHD